MTDEEIIAEIKKYPARQIVLTGGEPSLFCDRDFLCRLFASTDKRIAIETNGTHEIDGPIDWITLSPKFGMDAGNAEIVLSHADEIKVVDVGQDLGQYIKLAGELDCHRLYLQPCFVADPVECQKNLERTVQRVLDDPRWTLSLQTHRLLGIR